MARDLGAGPTGAVKNLGLIATTMDASAKARRSTLALCTVLAYLLIGRAINPGFTDHWWYQVAQTGGTLVFLVAVETAFARDGGLAWQTHLIVVATTLADTLGTAGQMYATYDAYDKVVHFWGGAAFAAVAYEVLGFLERREVIRLAPSHRALAAVAASMLIAGMAWETYEYLTDVAFGSGRVYGWTDTRHDLVADFLGATLAVVALRFSVDRVASASAVAVREPIR